MGGEPFDGTDEIDRSISPDQIEDVSVRSANETVIVRALFAAPVREEVERRVGVVMERANRSGCGTAAPRCQMQPKLARDRYDIRTVGDRGNDITKS